MCWAGFYFSEVVYIIRMHTEKGSEACFSFWHSKIFFKKIFYYMDFFFNPSGQIIFPLYIVIHGKIKK